MKECGAHSRSLADGEGMASPSPLIITQILTPKKRADLLHRQRLVDFIHEHIDRKLLLVSASAGYGKTSLLTDFAYDTDLPVCWLSAVEAASDPRVFLDYLIASISHHFPQFGRTSRELLQSSEVLSDAAPIVGTLVNEVYERIPDYFVVVIDDYHLVGDSQPINLLMDSLVQHLPENCHLIISSRTIPTLTPRCLALLTARQQVSGLGVNDLRFTAEEIQALLAQNYSQRLTDSAAKDLAEKSEGWITGILLTTHTLWKGLFEGIIRVRGSDSKVYDYLVNEVLAQQPPEVRDFLLATSVLEEMNPLLCDELLSVSNSLEMLKRLEDGNLFVSRLEREDERWYRYHHLFREFLLTKLQEENPTRVHGLHLRAATVLRETGAVEQAVGHCLTARDYDSAVGAILEIARATYDAGKLSTLARWIDALPAVAVASRPRLLWFRAKVHSELGELDAATALFDSAHAAFARGGDRLGQSQALVEKSAVLRLKGDLGQALEACEQAVLLVGDAAELKENAQVLASAHRQMGTCQAQLGNLAKGESELRHALRMYQDLGYPTNIAYVHNDLGGILGLAGDLTGSELHYRQALEVWEKIGNIGLAAMTINNIADGRYRHGEYDAALELYAAGLGHARKAGLDRTLAFTLAGIGDIRREQGAYQDALKSYEEGLQCARQSRDSFILCYLLDAIGNAHRLMGDHVRAIEFVRQAFERARERGAVYEMGLYQTSLGVINYQQGNIRQAEEYLLQAREIFVRSNARSDQAKAVLHLAQAYYIAGRLEEALECVRSVLDCLLTLGYDQFLRSAARETRAVVQYAVSRGLAGTLVEHLLDKADDAVAVAGGKDGPQPILIQPVLRVYAFGEGRVLRGDRLISNAEWGMAKAKELLFYLLCHRQRRKDQIGTDLWPELSPARLRSSFHVALYRLRRALDQQDCVIYEGDQYYFNRRIHYWFDVEKFEKSIDKAEALWAEDRIRAAENYNEAAVLYSGDLLEDMQTGHEWALLKMEELLRKYLSALLRLGMYHAERGDHRQAIGFYEQVLAKDAYQETAHREVMRCQALLGRRSAALRTYHRLAQLLEEELGVDPAPETTRLYEQILQNRITAT